MKLFVKYSRVSIVASVLALLVGSVVYYFSVRYVLIGELDDSLKVEEDEIHEYVRIQGRLPEPTSYRDQMITYQPAGSGSCCSRYGRADRCILSVWRSRKKKRMTCSNW